MSISPVQIVLPNTTEASTAGPGNPPSPSGRRIVFLSRSTHIVWQSLSEKAFAGQSWAQESRTMGGATGIMNSQLFLREQRFSSILPLLYPFRKALRFLCVIRGYAWRRTRTMAEQQGPEPQSHRTRLRRFKHLFRLVTNAQEHGLQKGAMISGTSGVGKTIGVEVFLFRTKHDRK